MSPAETRAATPRMTAVPRPLTAQDLPGLLAVQRACYGAAFLESAEVFARRLASPVNCSLVVEMDGQVGNAVHLSQ